MATGLIQPFLLDIGSFLELSLMSSCTFLSVCLDVLSLGYY